MSCSRLHPTLSPHEVIFDFRIAVLLIRSGLFRETIFFKDFSSSWKFVFRSLKRTWSELVTPLEYGDTVDQNWTNFRKLDIDLTAP